MSVNKKIIIFQPYITKYRIPIFSELTGRYGVIIAASLNRSYGNISKEDFDGMEFVPLKESQFLSGRICWQSGILELIHRIRPDIVFFSANLRYLSLWASLFFAKLHGAKVILHGQGLYNKPNPSIFHKILYALLHELCDKYICYTQSCKESLQTSRIYNKSVVVENSIINKHPVQKTTTNSNGILYIGRLRNDCKIELLIEAIELLRQENVEIELYIIGGGVELACNRDKYAKRSYIHFLGEVYDSKVISKVSKRCFTGCYPGDAGLSVLHYMSLSLPPIVHSSMSSHMGPEPSYVVNGKNGILFEKDSINSLISAIKRSMDASKQCQNLQKNAYATYEILTTPNLGQRILAVIDDALEDNQ